MIKQFVLVTSILCASSMLYASTDKKDNTHMFPEAKKGFVKHVIEVPKTDNNHDHKVELLIGKKMLVDCNQRTLRAKIENISLKGWGYKYLEVSDIQNGLSTMMACKEAKAEKFISVYMGEETLRRYNNRSPIVVYVPSGYEVRYRIWDAQKESYSASVR